jgi:uncharacterized protein (TIGR03437 family)
MRFARWFVLLAAAGAVYAQTAGASWDTSGNSMLSGTYYFRQVYYVIQDDYGDLGEAVTIYGNITFDGNGNYTLSNADIIDSSQGSGTYTGSGTYSIAASGYGFLSSPYATGDYIYGLVSKNGVFVGSTTDNGYGYNDMFVAAKVSSPAPSGSTLAGTWTGAVFDFSGGQPQYALSLVFTMNPDANGNLNVTGINGYTGGSSQEYTQSSGGLKYIFSNGAAVATFPSTGELMAGQKYWYFSPDGNFLFGGAPITSQTPYDFIVAVKTGSTSNTLSGLYYQAGLSNTMGDYEGSLQGNLDSYFGSFNGIAGAAPQTLLGHQRVNDFGGGSVYDYTYTNTISLAATGYNNGQTRFIPGAGGAELISSGVYPYLGISVALQAPTPSGSGVYLNPTGVVNAASYAPFTAGIAPGELLTLYGSNLAPGTQVAGTPFPTTGLDGVQVTIGGSSAAIYYVSPGQISAIVPYEVTVGNIVQIQVNNNGAMSNIVTNYVANTAPGVFTQNQAGTGYGEIEHLGIGNTVAAAGAVVKDSDPAIEGETLAAYLTGLGAVSPAITDGAPGPSSPSQTTNTISVDFSGVAGTQSFAGLAPGYSGLYQLNFTIPTSGITPFGPNFLDIEGTDAYMSYELLPIQATATAAVASGEAVPMLDLPFRFHRPAHAMPSLRNREAKKPFSMAHIATDNK